MHAMLFIAVFMIVLFVFLSGLKRERLENERRAKKISNKSFYGCPLYEDHFAIYNRMPIIE
jgi:hypothetical protein